MINKKSLHFKFMSHFETFVIQCYKSGFRRVMLNTRNAS